MINVLISDDYAVLNTTNYGFYYGYEFDEKEDEDGDIDYIWGFEVCEDTEKPFSISYDEMKLYKGCPSQWECEKCLLFGLGLWIEKSGGKE